jgi:hemerythrin
MDYMDDYNYILTGHTVIDKQHKVLFKLFDKCKAALDDNNTPAVRIVVYDLIKYSMEHFRYEEESMIQLKYNKDLYEEHVVQHSLFKAKMIEVTRRIDDLRNGLELLEFLRKWFEEHVQVIDQKFVDYLNRI